MGGDFNAVLNCEDRHQGNPVTSADVEDFQTCLQESELFEVRAIGDHFTWINNQKGANRIWSNIDRSFANTPWFSTYSHVVVERLARNVSDHCPQLVRFDDKVAGTGMFKFLNVLAEHEHFEELVRSNWGIYTSQCKLRDVWRKCQKLKRPLKQLNVKWFLKTTERVESIGGQLQHIQQHLAQDRSNDDLIQQETSLLSDLEK